MVADTLVGEFDDDEVDMVIATTKNYFLCH